MQLKKIGEFGLIELIRKKIHTKDKRVILNIGDDAAILRSSGNKYLVFTTDTLIEKIHFDLKYCSFKAVGWKSMTANLSDIAAMGGIPLAGLVSLGIPERIKVEEIMELYSGMKSLSTEYKCPIVGGDTFSSKALVITITLTGEVEKKLYKTRAGAKAGDLIFVTGDLGGAEAGLRFLKKFSGKKMLSSKITAIRKHLWPYPRIKEARLLVKNLKITSMIDISDGLSSDLHHVCEESEVGALIYENQIPISLKTTELCKFLNLSPLNTALSSGEEYELLFTLNPKDENRLRKIVRGKFKISLIGKIVKKEKGVKILGQEGRIRDLKKTGYAHF